MSVGTIKRIVHERGFGFISGEDGTEYFFHRSGLDASVSFDSLTGGEAVTFDVEVNPKGPRAMRVRATTAER
jgi:CspA family cold shock protein